MDGILKVGKKYEQLKLFLTEHNYKFKYKNEMIQLFELQK